MTIFNNRNDIILFLALLLNLHTVRNLTSGYLLILFATFAYLFLTSFNQIRFKTNFFGLSIILFYLWSVYVIFLSPAYVSLRELAVGASRFALAPSFLLILLANKPSDDHYEKMIRIYILITILASLSLIYQFFFGPITWFNDPSERGGLVRYASLQGSLTILGVTVGSALAIIPQMKINILLRTFGILFLIIGSILTLQKAAIANMAIAGIITLIFSKINFKITKTFIFSLIIIMIFSLIPESSFIKQYSYSLFYNAFPGLADSNTDILIDSRPLTLDSIIDRLNYFVKPFFAEYGYLTIFVGGIGLLGAGSGMGIEGHQAHNSLYDILLMGGGIYLILTMVLILLSLKNLYKINSKVSKYLLIGLIISTINMPFTTAGFFHPNISFFFYLSIAYSYHKKLDHA